MAPKAWTGVSFTLKFKVWVVAVLTRLLNWINSDELIIKVARDELYHAAVDLVASHDLFEISGEAKRHQVYAHLLKAFPSSPKRTIALAIEAALSTLS